MELHNSWGDLRANPSKTAKKSGKAKARDVPETRSSFSQRLWLSKTVARKPATGTGKMAKVTR